MEIKCILTIYPHVYNQAVLNLIQFARHRPRPATSEMGFPGVDLMRKRVPLVSFTPFIGAYIFSCISTIG